MYILKNAWISIIRNKGRNLLIGVIILVVACACTITLAINNTAADLINSYVSAYNKELTISFNRNAMKDNFDFSNHESMEEAKDAFNNIASYTIEDVEKFGDSDLIECYYYTYSISLNGDDIEKAEMDVVNDNNDSRGGMNKDGMMNDIKENALDFTLSGYSSIEAMSEFIDGSYTMVDISDDAWDIAFSGYYVFINEELATYNELEIGDTISFIDEDEENTYEFEIIGIFTDNASNDAMSMFSNSANTVVTNSNVLIEIANDNDSINGSVNPTFTIYDYDDADLILEEFYEKGLDENYTVETNQEIAESGLDSIKNVKSFATTFLVITLLIGGIVLFVLNMINIRERKYEIGVLRTIGLSKFKLTWQFVSELLMVACIALLLGAEIGATMSKNVSNSLLTNEIESSKESTQEMKNNFGGRGMNDDNSNRLDMPNDMTEAIGKASGVISIQAYDSIDAVVDITIILQLLGIGLLLVFVSSIASMISIQRFSPLTILKERS